MVQDQIRRAVDAETLTEISHHPSVARHSLGAHFTQLSFEALHSLDNSSVKSFELEPG